VTDAVEILDRVLAARGGRSFVSELTAIESIADDAAAEATCDRVLAIAAGRADPGPGAPRAHPRDLHDDFGDVLYVVARRCPQRFVDVVGADPELRVSTSVLRALSGVESPEAAAILIDAAQIRRAGHNFTRWSALGSLVALGHPRLPDLLVALVRDRDGLVRFSAVKAAIAYGDARLIAWLRRLVEGERTRPAPASTPVTPSRPSPCARASPTRRWARVVAASSASKARAPG
jgi:HEAT repeat protein